MDLLTIPEAELPCRRDAAGCWVHEAIWEPRFPGCWFVRRAGRFENDDFRTRHRTFLDGRVEIHKTSPDGRPFTEATQRSIDRRFAAYSKQEGIEHGHRQP